MKSLQRMKGYTLTELMAVIMIVLGAIGYGLNIYKLMGFGFETLTIEIFIRIAGLVIVPLGCIMGFFPSGA